MKYFKHFLLLFFCVHVAQAADDLQDVDVLRYQPNAPQFAALNISVINPRLPPLSEPLSGRIVYDEGRTSRVSASVVGRVTRIGAKPGDVVRRGQTLLELDAPELGAALADVTKADADLARYRSAYERARTFFERQSLSYKNLEQTDATEMRRARALHNSEMQAVARRNLDQALADLSKAEAEARRTKVRLDNPPPERGKPQREPSILLAPISGIITERHVTPGMQVRPDLPAPLFVISDLTHLWVIIELAERDLGKLRTGQSVAVSVDAYPGKIFMARVANIADAPDPVTRHVRVRVIMDNPEHHLKPEMSARVVPLDDGGQPVLVVPNSALVTEERRTFVFVETVPGELHKRVVQLGLQTRDFSVVENGLRAGDQVVTSGAVLLNSDLQR